MPVIPHGMHRAKPRPHRTSAGINRAHLPTLDAFAQYPRRAATNAAHPEGALLSPNINPNTTNTIFFDNFESGAPGWTTIGDNNNTPYYPNGHDFWNLVDNPQTLSVPSSVNPALVSYPDTAGSLPSAYSGTHAWWYGDNPADDTPNPSGASVTYMGNQSDWPAQTPGDGGTSNGPNSASLISPTIDLTSAPNATLTFATWWEIESVSPANFDMMYVDVSTDGGANWTTLGVLNPAANPAGGADPYPYTDNGLDVPASWQTASVDLTPYVGSQVQLRFRFDSVDQYDNGFRGWLIDDVGVYSNTPGSPLVSTIAPNSGVAGDTVTISGSGFGAQQNGSTVTFNGVQAAIQSWSDSSIVATVPDGATSGPVVVTVNGVQTAALDFTIAASIALSAPTSSPQMVDVASGAGFAPNEPLSIYLNGVNGTLLASTSADGSGNLPATNLTLPDMPAGNYLVLAEGGTSHITAGVTLSIVPALTSSVGIVKPSQSITVSAVGFAAYDSIQVQLDSTNNTVLGYFSCDINGDCSGNIVMPATSVVAGMHLLIASGSSGQIAEAPVTFTPAISASPTKGGPGTTITLSGAAFAANETVQITFGSSNTPEGSATTDAFGNLNTSFVAPAPLTPGTYAVTVQRTNQHPATVSTNFHVIPPKLVSSPGFHSGQSIFVQLIGFQGGENVTISWNANGGQQLVTIGMDSTGAAYYTFTPPSAPLGSYTLTATGDSSGLQATSSVHVGPGILLTPNYANPGATITVSGGGFTANESVSVYFQNTSNGTVPAMTDSTGAFTVSLTVPIKYNPSARYTVYAVGTVDKASAPFSYITPYFYAYYYYVDYGEQDTLYGQGFASNETVNLYWDYQQPGETKIATATAGSDGTFTVTISVPSDPNLGYVTIAAIGATSKLKATSSVYVYAALTLTPSSGPAGSKVLVKGGGFDASETVTVTYQGTTVGTATTNSDGAFALHFVVPTGTGIGYTTVSASGGTSGIYASATFTVTPALKISPTTGTSGTVITVTGNHFTASNVVYLYWFDPSTGYYTYFGTVNTSPNGSFTVAITAPAGLTSGNTYDVQGYDGYTGIVAEAAFVAQ
jgi:hypothetical protein